jgi:hypothetical protein
VELSKIKKRIALNTNIFPCNNPNPSELYIKNCINLVPRHDKSYKHSYNNSKFEKKIIYNKNKSLLIYNQQNSREIKYPTPFRIQEVRPNFISYKKKVKKIC